MPVTITATVAPPVTIKSQGPAVGTAYLAALDTDVTLAANSDNRVPSQKATKAYAEAAAASATSLGGLTAWVASYGGLADNGVTNNAAAIQAAINSGASVIHFGPGVYSYRTAARTTDPLLVHNYDGHALVIPAGRQIIFKGVGLDKTILKQLSVNGNSNNTDWQVVTGQVWRGAGIYLKGSLTAPATNGDGGGVTLMDMTLSGGVAYGASATAGQGGATYPANTTTGQGWDVQHKAIYCEPDRYTDHIRLIRTRITGFGGECTYQGGTDFHRELTILDSTIDETNGDAINPCCPVVNIRGLVIYRAFQAMEGWTGRAGGYIQLSAYNCLRAGPMQGGRAGAGTYSSYYAPTRYSDGILPLGTIHLTLVNCGVFYAGSFLTGTVDIIDGTVSVGEVAVFADGVRDTNLKIDITCDTIVIATAMNIQPGAAAGTQLTDTLRLRVTCGRTKEAKAAGRAITYPIRWGGSLGPNIYIEAGTLDALQPPQQYGAVTGYAPAFTSLLALGTGAGLALWNVETTPMILPLGPVLILSSTAASGTFTGTLSDTNAQPGQLLELRNGSGVKAFAISNSSNGSIAREIMIPPYHSIRYQYSHQGFWLPLVEPPALKGTATLDILAMLANAISVEQTITVLGARVGAPVTVSTSAAIAANAEVIAAYVSATDTVKFRLRDLTGAGYDPANAVYTAIVGNYS